MTRDEFRAAINRGLCTDDIDAETLMAAAEEIAVKILMVGDVEGMESGDVLGPLVKGLGLSVKQAIEVVGWAEKLAANQRPQGS